MNQSTLPVLIEPAQLSVITNDCPTVYNDNTARRDRCLAAGANILAQIEANGMTPELDALCANYLEKTRKTLKLLNEQRAPFTKIFDGIRAQFTELENSIDPNKTNTTAYQIQRARNAYAVRLREEAERRRQAELAEQRRLQVRKDYIRRVEDECKSTFNIALEAVLNALTVIYKSLTVDNYDEVYHRLKTYPKTLPENARERLTPHLPVPNEVTPDDAVAILQAQLDTLWPSFKQRYNVEVSDTIDEYLAMLPSRHAELKALAKANAEEAERLKAQIARREEVERKAREEEARAKTQQEEAEKQLKAQAAEIESLFGAAPVTTVDPQPPKVSVKKSIVPHDANGILAIVSFWWSQEGQYLPVEELEKIFKRQITFANKQANDKVEPREVESPFVHYTEEVKAK